MNENENKQKIPNHERKITKLLINSKHRVPYFGKFLCIAEKIRNR